MRSPSALRLFTAAVGLLAAAATGPAQSGPAPPVALPDPYFGTPAPAAEVAPAEPAPPPFVGPLLERTNLTGDWLGARGTLRDRGVTLDMSSTNFYQGVTTGGLEQGFRYGGRADYILNVDGHKAGLWQGLFVTLHGETLYGQSANELTGALMPVSVAQIFPQPDPVTALTGVKFTQALSENFLVYFGKINTADDFNQPFTGGARGVNGFMNGGVLFPAVLLRTVPYSTFGAGVVVLREKEPVFALSVFDTRNSPTTSGFDEFFTNGVTVNPQVTLPTRFGGLPGHHSFGGTYSSGKYAALDNLPVFVIQRLSGELPPLPRETGSWALYYLFDQALWVDECDPKRSWGLFGNAGLADGNPNPVRWSASIGVGGSSPLRSRPLDTFGVGYYYLGLGDSLKNFAPRLVPLGDEQGVEVFYNVGITPWFHLTPDLQVVLPARERVDTSVNFGLRAKLDF